MYNYNATLCLSSFRKVLFRHSSVFYLVSSTKDNGVVETGDKLLNSNEWRMSYKS